jgi:hypothetical protein
VYPLPFWLNGQTWYQKVLGGWQISGVTTLQTGLPVNIVIPGDQAGIGISNTSTNYGGQRPNLVGDAYLSTNRTQYLDPLAFAIPAAGTFGNLGAYAIHLPFWSNWDASLQKTFPIGEHVRANFRAELYNFPQHFSYTSISSCQGKMKRSPFPAK